MIYAEITIRDPNPIKRWLHRRRLLDALAPMADLHLRAGLRILDFGAGNGELVHQMARLESIETWVYEPTSYLMEEAKENLAGLDGVRFIANLDSVESAVFDYVFCLEVFEHLPDKEMLSAIQEISRLLKPDGIAVIGVPIELFAAAFIKGIFRMFRRYGAFDGDPGNIMPAVLGHPPSPRPAAEIFPKSMYYPNHLGFDFRILEQKLRQHFQISKKWFSPFPRLGAFFNSQIYFLLQKTQPASPDQRQQA